MKNLLVAALLLAAVSAVLSLEENVAVIPNDDINDYKLPNNSVPISYEIKLIPYIVEGNFTYDGESTIVLEVLEPSSSITLHILELTIDESSTSLVSRGNINYAIANHTYDTTKEFLILNFATNLPIGIYTLYLKYVGILNDKDLFGFSRSSYINDDGDTVWLAATQFSATTARQAFPCWDEPALKATFTISIKHDVSYTAISNMPVANQSAIDTIDNKLWTTFETTPVISTYLVAFVVSDFGYVSSENGNFKVWTHKNALSTVAYTLAVGVSEFEYLKEYISVPYFLPKMDQVFIPDSAFNSMENWGLVTYSEAENVYEEGVTPPVIQQGIAVTVTHNLVHQWFGNLVTPYEWKYLWLSEGFAVYFEHYITDQVQDNWRLMQQFVIKVIQEIAFVVDATADAHPLNKDASTPAEIDSLFGAICNCKGAAVIHMMSNIFTSADFRAGLIKYLTNHAYGVATPDDLWSALQEVSDENGISQFPVSIKTMMDTWVEQGGYPVVNVVRDYTNSTAVISQERFFSSGASDDGTRWWVPITYTTGLAPDFSSTSPVEWISQEDDSIVICGFDESDWVIFNIQQSAYYRVNYDEANWKLLTNYLDSENYVNIHVLNRAQLIDDSHYLAHANRISFSIFLDLTVYLRREIDYIPWYSMVVAFDFLNPLLANTESYPLYKTYILERLENALDFVGYYDRDDDEHVVKFFRLNTINWSCVLGNKDCRSNASAIMLAHMEDPVANPIRSDLLAWAYCGGLNNANATIWNKVFDLYVQSHSETTLGYLGCVEDEEILETFLTLASTDNTSILNDHAVTAFQSVYYGNPDNINFALDYFINNIERLYTFWNGSTGAIETILTDLGGRITTREQLSKFKTLIEEQNDLLGSIGSSGIATAESNVEWTDTYEPIFREWFNNFYDVENKITIQVE